MELLLQGKELARVWLEGGSNRSSWNLQLLISRCIQKHWQAGNQNCGQSNKRDSSVCLFEFQPIGS